MDVDGNGNTHSAEDDQSIPGSMQSSLSESYLTNSNCAESSWYNNIFYLLCCC